MTSNQTYSQLNEVNKVIYGNLTEKLQLKKKHHKI